MSQEFIQYVILYGYPAIFIILYLIEVGIPLPMPSELLLVFTGYLAFEGILNFNLLLAVAIIADFTGTMTLYTVFYFLGEFLILRKPTWIPLSNQKIQNMTNKINTTSWPTLFVFRITPFIRGYTSVVAGLLKLKPQIYLVISLGSSILVCSIYILVGISIGPIWKAAESNIINFMYFILICVLSAVCVYFIKGLSHKRSEMQIETDRLEFLNNGKIQVHMISETEFATKGQGVHTAYIEMIQLLENTNNLEVVTNGKGSGNIFHSHTYGPYYFWKGRKYKGRRILTAHVIPSSSKGSLPFWNLLMPLTRKYLKLAYSYADVVIAISPSVEQEILSLGVKSKIVRIYNPVILENWERTHSKRLNGRQSLGIQGHEKLVIGVGQLQERKGVEDFIDVAKAFPETKFVWVGGRPMGIFTEGINRINNRIKNAPPNIHFTGLIALSEMPKMYAAADVFLFPSYQENCPLAPLEAATAGLPVVFRDIPEYRSLFKGTYLKANSTQDFINITSFLLTNTDFYCDGIELSKKLIKQFDKDGVKQQLIELYTSLLNEYYQIEQKIK